MNPRSILPSLLFSKRSVTAGKSPTNRRPRCLRAHRQWAGLSCLASEFGFQVWLLGLAVNPEEGGDCFGARLKQKKGIARCAHRILTGSNELTTLSQPKEPCQAFLGAIVPVLQEAHSSVALGIDGWAFGVGSLVSRWFSSDSPAILDPISSFPSSRDGPGTYQVHTRYVPGTDQVHTRYRPGPDPLPNTHLEWRCGNQTI